jgi:diguanylate cyclase
MVILLWALLRIPMGVRAAGEWLRLGLDATTVMLGASLFTWYFVLSPLPLDRRAGAFWVNLVTAALALVGVAAVSKVCSPAAGRWTRARSASWLSGCSSAGSARDSRR